MAAPFISLGLKAANSLIDKHFEKIPDKYMHSNAYAPNSLPNPLRKKKKNRKDAQDQAQYPDSSRPASPPPQYVVEDADNFSIEDDIPRHSGATPDDFISPPGSIPQQYSTAPPKIRPEYIPPPPIGMVYPSPPPPQPNNQFPPQPTYNQFPPPRRNKYYPPSPPSTADPYRDRRRHRDGEQRHRHVDGRRNRSSIDDHRGRRPHNTRRSSSYEPPYERQVTRYNSDETSEESQTDEYYRSTRRPRMVTRRSSSYNGRASDNYYPPSTRENGRRRRNSVSPSVKRYSGFGDSRPQTSDSKESAQLFTKSKEGLLSGALGAVVGGWAAQRVQHSSSGRDGKRASGKGKGRGQEDDKILTLLGAAVGGLAANAVVEHMEEGKVRKERVENGKRDSRVYAWDDGYS